MELLENFDKTAVFRMLGENGKPDEATERLVDRALGRLCGVCRPRSVYRLFQIERSLCGMSVAGAELLGDDIARHLDGCNRCAVLALTLGESVDAATRAAFTVDAELATALDCAASALCEHLCGGLELMAREQCLRAGLFLTDRFSPGYGDFPIVTNRPLLESVSAFKTVGITALESGAMSPRKSVCALCGASAAPVAGQRAGCENCALRDKCKIRKEGRHCE
ncbi:MAG: methionine synthase [Oscillospiraceae bacterium]